MPSLVQIEILTYQRNGRTVKENVLISMAIVLFRLLTMYILSPPSPLSLQIVFFFKEFFGHLEATLAVGNLECARNIRRLNKKTGLVCPLTLC